MRTRDSVLPPLRDRVTGTPTGPAGRRARRWLPFGRRPADRHQAGEGTAWIIFDAGGDIYRYQCHWFAGPSGDHLFEHARAATDVDAVGWALARTPRVRIRQPDHRTYWAGSAPDPGGFAGTWVPPVPLELLATPAAPSRQPPAADLDDFGEVAV